MKKIAMFVSAMSLGVSVLTLVKLKNTEKIFTDRYKKLTLTNLKLANKISSINLD